MRATEVSKDVFHAGLTINRGPSDRQQGRDAPERIELAAMLQLRGGAAVVSSDWLDAFTFLISVQPGL